MLRWVHCAGTNVCDNRAFLVSSDRFRCHYLIIDAMKGGCSSEKRSCAAKTWYPPGWLIALRPVQGTGR